MGKLKNGILNGFSGKIGPVEGYQTGEEYYIRAKRRPRTKFTPKELLSQAKFKMVRTYLSPFIDVLRVGFAGYYTKTGGFRGAISYTMKEVIQQNADGFFIDPQLIKISGGTLAPAVNPQVEIGAGKEVRISWDQSNTGWQHRGDQLMVLVYDAVSGVVDKRIFDGAYRQAGEFKMTPKVKLRNKEVDIYIGFMAADRSAQSDSQYLGRFTL
ncbi:DUF6266 family protein [Pedobacter frigidisoli]|uniref:DUF6266 family protein n=1 Tax=Pedobacter frigidisoli TaxID=2530455 RepID=UPI00292D5F6D|nr:DUF6266 family protein [Pedobacter frigidisoli]